VTASWSSSLSVHAAERFPGRDLHPALPKPRLSYALWPQAPRPPCPFWSTHRSRVEMVQTHPFPTHSACFAARDAQRFGNGSTRRQAFYGAAPCQRWKRQTAICSASYWMSSATMVTQVVPPCSKTAARAFSARHAAGSRPTVFAGAAWARKPRAPRGRPGRGRSCRACRPRDRRSLAARWIRPRLPPPGTRACTASRAFLRSTA
jgi:hypothetical protein